MGSGCPLSPIQTAVGVESMRMRNVVVWSWPLTDIYLITLFLCETSTLGNRETQAESFDKPIVKGQMISKSNYISLYGFLAFSFDVQ